MAEAEMPAGMTVPPEVLPQLRPHLLFAVPRQDGRFSSFLLTDEAYARAQIAGLREADQRKTSAN